jgi:hypothetical protein
MLKGLADSDIPLFTTETRRARRIFWNSYGIPPEKGREKSAEIESG